MIDFRLRAKIPKHMEHRMFLTADTDFGRCSVIKKRQRPYLTVKDMDDTLVKRWNGKVPSTDNVIVVGDFAQLNHGDYEELLNGYITHINGDYCKVPDNVPSQKSLIIEARGMTFLLVHNPNDLEPCWHDWVEHENCYIIAGERNVYPYNPYKSAPFYDKKNKMFNVSVDATHYQPVSLQYICDVIENDGAGLQYSHTDEIVGFVGGLFKELDGIAADVAIPKEGK